MSLSGATRALGSSIIEGSHLEAGWAAPGGGHLFTGSRAPGKGCWACRAPRMRIAGGGSDTGGGRPYRLGDGLQAVENRTAGSRNAGLGPTASPAVSPRAATVVPYLSIQ